MKKRRFCFSHCSQPAQPTRTRGSLADGRTVEGSWGQCQCRVRVPSRRRRGRPRRAGVRFKRPKSAGSSHERSWLSLLRPRDASVEFAWGQRPTAMRPRPGVYLAEGTFFAKRFARWNSSFHENSGWLWSSKEIKLFVWAFWGASTPVPSSSPPALPRRARRRSRSQRRAPRRRRRGGLYSKIGEQHCTRQLSNSAPTGC